MHHNPLHVAPAVLPAGMRRGKGRGWHRATLGGHFLGGAHIYSVSISLARTSVWPRWHARQSENIGPCFGVTMCPGTDLTPHGKNEYGETSGSVHHRLLQHALFLSLLVDCPPECSDGVAAASYVTQTQEWREGSRLHPCKAGTIPEYLLRYKSSWKMVKRMKI